MFHLGAMRGDTNALDHIRSGALEASKSLAAVCPKNGSANIHERLETLGRTLEAMAVSPAQLPTL